MAEMMDEQGSAPAVESKPSGKASATLTVLGVLCVIIAFSILYRAERTNNRRWIAAHATPVDPNDPGSDVGMARFSGVPEGDFVENPDTGKRFVYLSRSRYEFARGAEPSAAPDWKYAGGAVELAKEIRIGTVRLRLDEAEIIGRDVWSTTIMQPRREEGAPPRIGDRKVRISGIPGEIPLFCAGRLAGGYLGAGDLFIVSAYSEGKTLDELRETWVWRWIRNPVCFFLLLVGLAMLGQPAMRLMRSHSDLPVVHSLSRIGWPAYLLISVALSFALVRFSHVTADLLWLIVILVVGIPALAIVRKMMASKSP